MGYEMRILVIDIIGENQGNADFAQGPRFYFHASALSFFSFPFSTLTDKAITLPSGAY